MFWDCTLIKKKKNAGKQDVPTAATVAWSVWEKPSALVFPELQACSTGTNSCLVSYTWSIKAHGRGGHRPREANPLQLLLNRHIVKQPSIHLLLYPYSGAAVNPGQRSFLLPRAAANTESHNWLMCWEKVTVGCSALGEASTNPTSQGTSQKKQPKESKTQC